MNRYFVCFFHGAQSTLAYPFDVFEQKDYDYMWKRISDICIVDSVKYELYELVWLHDRLYLERVHYEKKRVGC